MSYVHGNPNPTFTLNQFIQASLANPEVANVPGPDDWIDKNTISVLSGWTAGVFAIGQKDSLLETLLNHRFSMRKARSTPQFILESFRTPTKEDGSVWKARLSHLALHSSTRIASIDRQALEVFTLKPVELLALRPNAEHHFFRHWQHLPLYPHVNLTFWMAPIEVFAMARLHYIIRPGDSNNSENRWIQLLLYKRSIECLGHQLVRSSFPLEDPEKWVDLVVANKDKGLVGQLSLDSICTWFNEKRLQSVPYLRRVVDAWTRERDEKEIILAGLVELWNYLDGTLNWVQERVRARIGPLTQSSYGQHSLSHGTTSPRSVYVAQSRRL